MTTTDAKELFKSAKTIIAMEYENYKGWVQPYSDELKKKFEKEQKPKSLEGIDGEFFYTMDLYLVDLNEIKKEAIIELIEAYEEAYLDSTESGESSGLDDYSFGHFISEGYTSVMIWADHVGAILDQNPGIPTLDPNQIESRLLKGINISDIEDEMLEEIIDSGGGDSDWFFIVDGVKVNCLYSTPESTPNWLR